MFDQYIINSIKYKDSINEILDVVEKRNQLNHVSIKKISLDECLPWVYTEFDGLIHNNDNSFFQIGAMRYRDENSKIEQPIIFQDEIGYLGIITKVINNRLMLLMQLKVEPGNINLIQISPTIQATKSNFTQKHGGKQPLYLEYFKNVDSTNVIYDQLQSEQGSRFYKKRNRNIIIIVEDNILVSDSHIWLSLGQINALLKHDNLVNMDTRSVLSGFPYYKLVKSDVAIEHFHNRFRINSIFGNLDEYDLQLVYSKLNNYKMNCTQNTEKIKITSLLNWRFTGTEISHKLKWPFKVVFCEIEIEGREVKKWNQPLIESNEIATFGIIIKEISRKEMILTKIVSEIGTFDKYELGPTVQIDSHGEKGVDVVENFFIKRVQINEGLLSNVLLSEEGGRFYHEQNRNIIIKCDYEDLVEIPDNYIWVDYKTLTALISHFNVVNIQLRNLLSLMEIE